jgi:hypothetical protein
VKLVVKKRRTTRLKIRGRREGGKEGRKEGGPRLPDVGILVRDKAQEAVGHIQLHQLRVQGGGSSDGLKEEGRREGGRERWFSRGVAEEGGREGGRKGPYLELSNLLVQL